MSDTPGRKRRVAGRIKAVKGLRLRQVSKKKKKSGGEKEGKKKKKKKWIERREEREGERERWKVKARE